MIKNKEAKARADKAYRERNKEKIAARKKEWVAANRHLKNAANKVWADANRERIRAEAKATREASPEKSIEAQRKWRQRNPERSKQHSLHWRTKNRHVVNQNTVRYRAAKLKATPTWADPVKIAEFYETADALSMWTGEWHHVDHIVPLRGAGVQGFHVQDNLQILTRFENISKNARYWPDMPEAL